MACSEKGQERARQRVYISNILPGQLRGWACSVLAHALPRCRQLFKKRATPPRRGFVGSARRWAAEVGTPLPHLCTPVAAHLVLREVLRARGFFERLRCDTPSSACAAAASLFAERVDTGVQGMADPSSSSKAEATHERARCGQQSAVPTASQLMLTCACATLR